MAICGSQSRKVVVVVGLSLCAQISFCSRDAAPLTEHFSAKKHFFCKKTLKITSFSIPTSPNTIVRDSKAYTTPQST